MYKFLMSIFVITLSLFAETELHLTGSTTIQPIFEELKPYFQKNFNLNLIIEGGGSQKGVDLLSTNMTDIAMVSRNLTENEKEKYNFVTIGYDGLAIIIHKDNPIQKITTEQLKNIYNGKITNYKELDPKFDEEILVISKMIGRGTLDIFEHYIQLQSPKTTNKKSNYPNITDKAWEAGANNDVIVWVAGVKNAIGFVSFGSIKTFDEFNIPIKLLPLDSIQPTNESIKNKTYPIVRELNLVYLKSNPNAESFIKNLQIPIVIETIEKYNFIKADHENK